MTILFIGNGFYLACGYNTAYKDFVQSQIFYNLKQTNKLAQFIYSKLQDYDSKWVDVEEELINYSKQLSSDYGDHISKETNETFKSEYQELTRSLELFLKNPHRYEVTKEAIEHLRFLFNMTPTTDNKITTYSFNYLCSESDYFKVLLPGANITYNYVHGSLYDPTDPGIVIGVDETNRINRQHSFLFKSHNDHTKTFGYQNTLEKADTYVFFGCSIGITDTFYFRQLFLSSRQKNFIIYYHGEDMEDYIKDRIQELSGSLANFVSINKVSFMDDTKN